MRLRIQKTRQVKTPTRSHEYDAGLDFYIPDDMPWDTFTVWPRNSILIATGIKVDIPDGFALFCFERSSVAKKGLICGARVCDAGYQGEIHMQVINVGKDAVIIKPGEKLAQFILLPVVRTEVVVVSDRPLFDERSERGEGGFGSTGTGLPKKAEYQWQVEAAIKEIKDEPALNTAEGFPLDLLASETKTKKKKVKSGDEEME